MLQNANIAALISFLVGTTALILLLVVTRTPMPARDTLASVPAWAWFGGLMGAFYVAISTVVASQLGTTSLSGLALLGPAGHGAAWSITSAGWACPNIRLPLLAWRASPCWVGVGVWLDRVASSVLRGGGGGPSTGLLILLAGFAMLRARRKPA